MASKHQMLNDTPAIELGNVSSRREHEDLELQSEKPRSRWAGFLERNRGVFLILIAEIFGAGMAATTRLLQLGSGTVSGMDTLQILFARFSITFLLSTGYMWYARIPNFLLGAPEVRWMLVLRGLCGFGAVCGFYYSIRYLALSEAITLSFLTPLCTAYASSLFLHEPFTRRQLFAGLVCFFGIILVAQPWTVLTDTDASPAPNTSPSLPPVTAFERFSAIGLGLLSILMATGSYTTIRLVGPRAHTLISVNYYAFITTLLSGAILALPSLPDPFPSTSFKLPANMHQWILLVAIGIFGFVMQTLITMGLLNDKSARATNVMYVQIVFALVADAAIWGVVPDFVGWVGMSVVVAGTVWGVLMKSDGRAEADLYTPVAGEEFVLGSEDDEDEHGSGSEDDEDEERESEDGKGGARVLDEER